MERFQKKGGQGKIAHLGISIYHDVVVDDGDDDNEDDDDDDDFEGR